jgi:hypothetical protein
MYSTTQEIWDTLGKDTFTKVRSEVVGTSSTTAATNYSLQHDNLVTNSCALYSAGTAITNSAYSVNIDDGRIIGLTGATSGSEITADYNYTDVSDSVVQRFILASDELILKNTGRNFVATTGCTEYIDVEEYETEFFLKNRPVNSISSVNINTVDATTAPSWFALTEGLGGDYLMDYDLGKITFINNFPYHGYSQLKVIYNYGYTTTPAMVKELSILMTLRQMQNSAIYKSVFRGFDNFTPVKLAEIDARIQELTSKLRDDSFGLI